MGEPKQSGVPVAGPSGDSVGVDAFQHVNHIDHEAQSAHCRYFTKQQDPNVLGCGNDRERRQWCTARTASSVRATSSDASDARNAGEGGDTNPTQHAKTNAASFYGMLW